MERRGYIWEIFKEIIYSIRECLDVGVKGLFMIFGLVVWIVGVMLIEVKIYILENK